MIKIGSALVEHAEQLERERGIAKDVLFNSLKEAMVAAYRRYAKLESSEGIICKLVEKSGEITLYEQLEVVKDAEKSEAKRQEEEEEAAMQAAERAEEIAEARAAAEEAGEEYVEPEPEVPEEPEEKKPRLKYISLKDARKEKADVELDEILEIEVTPDDFGRIAAQTAKQVITQRIREAEKLLVMKEFEEKQGIVTTGIVQRIEGRNVVVSIGKSEAILPPREQLPGEYYRVGNKLRVFVLDLRDSGRVPQIIVSQGHAAMVREIFELEVPEIEDNIVVIQNIAREAGYRTKVAVSSNDPEVDPQGACIGTRGSRIQAIVNELKNEKIDIIKWSDDPREFIINALAPAKIVNVELPENMEEPPFNARVIVPDDQLSLAIGRDGQNVRLAAKLTGFRIDIKSLSQYKQEEDPADEPEVESEEGAYAEEHTEETSDVVEAGTTEELAAEESSEDTIEAVESVETDGSEESEESVAETEEEVAEELQAETEEIEEEADPVHAEETVEEDVSEAEPVKEEELQA
ncbi:MAG: transcription termination factor NusA [Vampirovibrio sp.]|nr:transcription termination factor NusA [Vampirovibrio sp.]